MNISDTELLEMTDIEIVAYCAKQNKWEAAIYGEKMGRLFFRNLARISRNPKATISIFISTNQAEKLVRAHQIEMGYIIPAAQRPLVAKGLEVGFLSEAYNYEPIRVVK